MTPFVLDNSVAMRWCFDEVHPYADSVLTQLAAGGEAFVPILWRYEVVSVFAKGQKKGTLGRHKAAELLDDFDAYRITVDLEGAERIFSDVHRLANTHRLTGYDAAYLELAQRRGLPLATLDMELIRACQESGITHWQAR